MESYLSKITKRTFGIHDIRQIKPQIKNWLNLKSRHEIDSNGNFDEFNEQESKPSSVNAENHLTKPDLKVVNEHRPVTISQPTSKKKVMVTPDSTDVTITADTAKENIKLNTTLSNTTNQIKTPIVIRKKIGRRVNVVSAGTGIDRGNKNIYPEAFSLIRSNFFEEKKNYQDSTDRFKKSVHNEKNLQNANGVTTKSIEPKIAELSLKKRIYKANQQVDSSQALIPFVSTPPFRPGTTKPKSRLVIGKLKVEVIQTPKTVKQNIQLPQQDNSAASKSQQGRTIRGSGLKVQFGMWQI